MFPEKFGGNGSPPTQRPMHAAERRRPSSVPQTLAGIDGCERLWIQLEPQPIGEPGVVEHAHDVGHLGSRAARP